MTVKELCETLESAGWGDDNVQFRIKGTVYAKEDLDGHYYGRFAFQVDLDEEAEIYAIEWKANTVEVTLEI